MKGLKLFLLVNLTLIVGFLTECSHPKHNRNTHYMYAKPSQLDDEIQTSHIAQVGMDSSKILQLTQLILADSFPNIHSLLIMKDNQLIYENYFAGYDEISGSSLGYIEHGREDIHDARSISKSVVSACMGIALQKGLLKSVDEPIINYFPEYESHFDSLKRKITIRHLLTMSGGMDWNEMGSYGSIMNSELRMDLSFNPTKYILKRRIVTSPGKVWNYNGGGTQLLAEIINKVSGLSINEFAEKYLFNPLGIKKYAWTPLIIRKSIPAAASGLRLTSRDFLKFGMLFMNEGKWNDSTIINKDWVNTSVSTLIERPKSDSLHKKGYGYQFWTYSEIINGKSIDITQAKGNGGQAIFLVKSLNLLVVITAGNYNKWNIVNNSNAALSNFIIPAIKDEKR
jgi:CubicO group peptidase (beta-lactamase class C family)